MSWFAVWRTADGALVSTGTVLGSPLPGGLSSTDFGTPQTGLWNAATHVFDAAPVLKSVLTLRQFWDRWTTAEREALMNLQQTGTQAQKNKLYAFKDYVHDAGLVDCNDAYIQTSVNLAETAGIIGAGRAAVILA
jgi:hypothetical protein